MTRGGWQEVKPSQPTEDPVGTYARDQEVCPRAAHNPWLPLGTTVPALVRPTLVGGP